MSETARPMPPAPPVTMATRPSNGAGSFHSAGSVGVAMG